MQVTRTGLIAAVKMIDGKIPEGLEPYWATIKKAIDELPNEVLMELLLSISKQLNKEGQCLIIEQGDDLRIIKDIQTFLFKD